MSTLEQDLDEAFQALTLARRQAQQRAREARARAPTIMSAAPPGVDRHQLALEAWAWLGRPEVIAVCRRLSATGLGAVTIARARSPEDLAFGHCDGWASELRASGQLRLSAHHFKGPTVLRPASPKALAEAASPALLWATVESFRSGHWRECVLGAVQAARLGA